MAVTELEGVILGIVSSRQPCPAYVVRQRFAASPTWGWSNSKGAIYPAVSRLVARGYLASERATADRRQKGLLNLTDAGQAELVSWLKAIVPEMGGAPVDPLRTRVNYLANLTPRERHQFLDRAEAAARDALMKATVALPDPNASDLWTLHATALGVLLQTKAKLDWIQAVRRLAESDWVASGAAAQLPTAIDG
jgi:DNA-binding PadR family transcriptional regulator